jgi:hypothetical protein
VCERACAGTFRIVCPKIKIHKRWLAGSPSHCVCTCVCRLRGATSRTPRTWFARSWAEKGARHSLSLPRPGRATAPKVQLPPTQAGEGARALLWSLWVWARSSGAGTWPHVTLLCSHFSLQMHIYVVQYVRFTPVRKLLLSARFAMHMRFCIIVKECSLVAQYFHSL